MVKAECSVAKMFEVQVHIAVSVLYGLGRSYYESCDTESYVLLKQVPSSTSALLSL